MPLQHKVGSAVSGGHQAGRSAQPSGQTTAWSWHLAFCLSLNNRRSKRVSLSCSLTPGETPHSSRVRGSLRPCELGTELAPAPHWQQTLVATPRHRLLLHTVVTSRRGLGQPPCPGTAAPSWDAGPLKSACLSGSSLTPPAHTRGTCAHTHTHAQSAKAQ